MTLTRMDLRLLPYRTIYDRYFKATCEIKPHGVLSKDAVMRELADYAILRENTERVFRSVTGIDVKAATHSEIIIALFNDLVERRIQEALED